MKPPLAMRYLSEEWAEAALRLVETDGRVRAALGGVALSLLMVVQNPPKGSYGFIYAAFDRSGLCDYRVGHDPAKAVDGLDSPTFVVRGEYAVFAAVQSGKLSERKALLSGKLHLTGPLIKALKHMRALEAITKVFATIPCEV